MNKTWVQAVVTYFKELFNHFSREKLRKSSIFGIKAEVPNPGSHKHGDELLTNLQIYFLSPLTPALCVRDNITFFFTFIATGNFFLRTR
jgi:hypothetical protein